MEQTKTFWTCPNCNEQVEEHFAACWNCKHNRDGNLVQGLSNSSEHRETPIPTDKAPNRICLCCQTNLVYAGKKEFHEGRIGQGKAVVVVISEKYLKSKNCMFEMLEIAKEPGLRERIFRSFYLTQTFTNLSGVYSMCSIGKRKSVSLMRH